MSEAREFPEELRAQQAAESADDKDIRVPVTKRVTFLGEKGEPLGWLDPKEGLVLRVLTIGDEPERPIARISAKEQGLVLFDPEWKSPYHRRLRLSREGVRINDRSGHEAAFLGWGPGIGPHLHMYSVLTGEDSDPLLELSIIEEWEDRRAWGTMDLYNEEVENIGHLPGDLHSHDDEG